MSKWMISFLSVITLTLMFSGCGSEGNSKSSSGGTPAADTGTQTDAGSDFSGDNVDGIRGLSSLPPVPQIPQ